MGREFLCIKEHFQSFSAGGLVLSPSSSPLFLFFSCFTLNYLEIFQNKNILKIIGSWGLLHCDNRTVFRVLGRPQLQTLFLGFGHIQYPDLVIHFKYGRVCRWALNLMMVRLTICQLDGGVEVHAFGWKTFFEFWSFTGLVTRPVKLSHDAGQWQRFVAFSQPCK